MSLWLRLSCVLVATMTTSCVESAVLEQFTNIDVRKTVLSSGTLVTLMGEGAFAGRTMAGAALVLLCLVLGFRAHQGQPWLGLAKECFVGGVACVLILSTYTLPGGPVRGVADVGWDLYDGSTAGHKLLDVLFPLMARDARWMQNAHDMVEGIQDQAVRQNLQVFLFRWSQPFWTALFGTNVLWIFVLRYILLATYSFLVAFYWVLTPYMAWTIVLPQTRSVFKGFAQSYAAVCLWPLLLGIVERLVGALPWTTWLPPLSADPSRATSQWAHNQLVLFSMNAVFLSAIASIPVVASKTVSGAVRSAMK